MSTNILISQDANSASKIVQNNSVQYGMYTAAANSHLNLITALTSNASIVGSVNWTNTFLTGYVHYKNVYDSPKYSLAASTSLFGNINNYKGNLNDWTINVVAGAPITYNILTGGPDTTCNILLTDNVTVSSILIADIKFIAERFSFLCQYLWADPSTVTLPGSSTNHTPSLSDAANLSNPSKFGLYYTATTLKQSACAVSIDNTFYQQKSVFLSSMT